MAGETVRVLGIEGVRKNLDSLSDTLRADIIMASARAAVRVFAREVQRTTYAANRQQRSGLLLASQRWSVRAKGEEITAKFYTAPSTAAGFVGGRPRLQSAMPKPSAAFYWRFLEFGTQERYTRSKTKATTLGASGGFAFWRTRRMGVGAYRGKITPRPWVGPAFESQADAAIETFTETATSLTDKAVQELSPSLNQGVVP